MYTLHEVLFEYLLANDLHNSSTYAGPPYDELKLVLEVNYLEIEKNVFLYINL